MLWFDFFPVFLGPFVGSFLFAAAVRYPQMTGFVTGRSMCPSCRAQIAIRDLLPVFGWLLLGGRCRVCATLIGWQYPAVELAATAIALWAVAEFSGWLLWVSCALGWVLMALSIIDWRCSRLPDALTLPLLLLGLAVAAVNWPTELADHVFGAVVGYSGLAAIAWAYRRLRGFDGLGLGDAKLLAAGGAWLSWQAVPMALLLAAILALAFVFADRAVRRVPLCATTAVAFGPYLAAAIWLIWLYGSLFV